ncbi:hypothetical protein A2U01_0103325, partial [Trifolium medium]|nr:hypothetical protein [Trifolium medium]
MFSNEPHEVILEFMRAMKDNDNQPVSEDKGAEGTSTTAVV